MKQCPNCKGTKFFAEVAGRDVIEIDDGGGTTCVGRDHIEYGDWPLECVECGAEVEWDELVVGPKEEKQGEKKTRSGSK